ncbi:MAG TPA: TadE family type IV pilus minor pilin [Microbacterium sp.]|jgi:Flp pilus assembly protein TadG|nr:TadE family type IV pilus minor pilin [Microbacterium sp.]
MIRRGLGDDRGSVVAEFAIALPAVALVLLMGAGALSTCAQQVRLQDAAADAARLSARGESDARARAAVSAAVPGAAVDIGARGDLVCVTASANSSLPITLSATSCALAGGL